MCRAVPSSQLIVSCFLLPALHSAPLFGRIAPISHIPYLLYPTVPTSRNNANIPPIPRINHQYSDFTCLFSSVFVSDTYQTRAHAKKCGRLPRDGYQWLAYLEVSTKIHYDRPGVRTFTPSLLFSFLVVSPTCFQLPASPNLPCSDEGMTWS
ncbi:hypothetical protein QBC45DRAFT_132904 [Copromyces sp. CBS 386.78]|nr:hypothetical protein QBC45DRAFT_132904 [Copromyces sp. CBS 386.78]